MAQIDLGTFLAGGAPIDPNSVTGQRMQIYQQLINNPGVQLPVYQPQGFTPAEQQAQSEALSSISSGHKDMGKQQEQIRQQTEVLNQATQAGAAAKQAEIDARQQQSQMIADTAQRSIDAYGSDIMNPDSKVSRAAALLNANDEAVMANAQKLREAQTATLVSDPFTAMLSFITVPVLQRQHNALATEGAALQNVVDNSVREATAQTQLAVQAIPSMTTAMAAAQKEVTAQLANATVAEANIALARDETQYIFNKNKMVMDKLAVVTNQGELKRNENYKKFSSQVDAARAAANNYESKMRYALAALDLKETAQDEAWTLNVIKDGARVMGIPENTIGGMTIDSIKRLPKDWKDNMFKYGVTGAAGATPLEAMNNIQANPGAALPPKAVKTYQLLADVYKKTQADIQRNPAYMQASDKDKPKVLQQEFNAQLRKQFDNATDSEMLRAPVVNQVLNTQAIPGIGADNKPISIPLNKIDPATRNALSPLAKASQVPNDAQVAQTIVTGLMARGAKPQAVAQELVNYFSNAAAIRNTGVDFSRFSMGSDPELLVASRRYRVKGPAGGILGGNVSYDLTNPAEAQRYILGMQNANNNIFGTAKLLLPGELR